MLASRIKKSLCRTIWRCLFNLRKEYEYISGHGETVGGKEAATGSADTSNGNVYGDGVGVDDYLLEVDE